MARASPKQRHTCLRGSAGRGTAREVVPAHVGEPALAYAPGVQPESWYGGRRQRAARPGSVVNMADGGRGGGGTEAGGGKARVSRQYGGRVRNLCIEAMIQSRCLRSRPGRRSWWRRIRTSRFRSGRSGRRRRPRRTSRRHTLQRVHADGCKARWAWMSSKRTSDPVRERQRNGPVQTNDAPKPATW